VAASTSAPLRCRAAVAAPIVTARSPNALLTLMRSSVPPALVCTMLRTVWLSSACTVDTSSDGAMALPAQVATQGRGRGDAAEAAGPAMPAPAKTAATDMTPASADSARFATGRR
jgi:hypothetical protein